MAATPSAATTALAAALTLILAQAFDWTQDDWVDLGLGLSEICGANGGLGLRKICGSGAQDANGLSLRKVCGAGVPGANGL